MVARASKEREGSLVCGGFCCFFQKLPVGVSFLVLFSLTRIDKEKSTPLFGRLWLLSTCRAVSFAAFLAATKKSSSVLAIFTFEKAVFRAFF